MPATQASAGAATARVPTVAQVLRDAAARLARVGCDTPRLDAEVLLASVLEVERARLVMDATAPVAPALGRRFEALVARREAHEPVAYLVGRRAFRRISLLVDPRVLIPRPETELLVEVALNLPPGCSVIDVGTGSGAVALAVKDERPDLEVAASDMSADALAVACANREALGLDVELVKCDLLPPRPFDAVLANLPYVREDDPLPADVERYEPRGALFAGEDGLTVIRRLVARLPGATTLVALEVGEGQAAAVEALLRGAGLGAVERWRDLAGIERVVVGRR